MTEAPMPCCGRSPCRARAASGEEHGAPCPGSTTGTWSGDRRAARDAMPPPSRWACVAADAEGEHPGKRVHDLAQRSSW